MKAMLLAFAACIAIAVGAENFRRMLAGAAGMDADLVRTLLASDADLQEVRDEDAQAREIGVTGVPTFIVAEQYALQGAQPPEVWAKVIEELSGPSPAGTA